MDRKLEPYSLSEGVWMVPCLSNREGNIYQPMLTPLSTSKKQEFTNIRKSWSEEEDKAIESLTALHGTKAWSVISKEINAIFHHGEPFRKGKQCRERFCNHINPSLKKGDWEEHEDQCILEMQSANGNKWSDIAKNLSGRNENQVKNRWKTLIAKRKSEKKYTEIPVQPIPIAISPPTSFISYKIDPGFSTLADIILSKYYSQADDATPPFHLYFP